MRRRQAYHLEPPAGLMNDPCGLSWFGGRFRCFFQWNPRACDHSHKDWGLYSSEDLVRWRFEGAALTTDKPYDKNGVYTGNALVVGDELWAYYCGNVRNPDGSRTSSQCLATSKDGVSFEKHGVVVQAPPAFTGNFRDPYVTRSADGTFHMLIGAQTARDGYGAIAYCTSGDGIHWTSPRPAMRSAEVQMIECPVLCELDGQVVLLYCRQRRDNAADRATSYCSAYKVLDAAQPLDGDGDFDLDQGWVRVDDGFDFYAPQAFRDGTGRTLMFGWMSLMDAQHERAFAEGDDRIHCLTIPRELSLERGHLVQSPARELYGLPADEVRLLRRNDGALVGRPRGNAFRLLMREVRDESIDVELRGGEVRLSYDPTASELSLSRRDWVTGEMERRVCSVSELHEVELWSDTTSVEVFANGGMAALSARIHPRSEETRVVVGCQAAAQVQLVEIKTESERK